MRFLFSHGRFLRGGGGPLYLPWRVIALKNPLVCSYVNNGLSVKKAKVIKPDSLRILYYNVRSVLPKLDDLWN